jgi:hypothetical protein
MVFEQGFDCPGPDKICVIQSYPSTHAVTLDKVGYSHLGDFQSSGLSDSVAYVEVEPVTRSADGFLSDIDISLGYNDKCVSTYGDLDCPDDDFDVNSWSSSDPLPQDVSWLNDDDWSQFLMASALKSVEDINTYSYNEYLLTASDVIWNNEVFHGGTEFGYINVNKIANEGYQHPVKLLIHNLGNSNFSGQKMRVSISYKCYTASYIVNIPVGVKASVEITFLESPDQLTLAHFKIGGTKNEDNGVSLITFHTGYRVIGKCANRCYWQGVDKNGNSYELRANSNGIWSYRNVTQNITLATEQNSSGVLFYNPVELDAGGGFSIKGDSNGYFIKEGPCVTIGPPAEEDSSDPHSDGEGSTPFTPPSGDGSSHPEDDPNNSDSDSAGNDYPVEEGDETTTGDNEEHPCVPGGSQDEQDLNNFICVSGAVGENSNLINGTYQKTTTNSTSPLAGVGRPVYKKTNICKEATTGSNGEKPQIFLTDYNDCVCFGENKIPVWAIAAIGGQDVIGNKYTDEEIDLFSKRALGADYGADPVLIIKKWAYSDITLNIIEGATYGDIALINEVAADINSLFSKLDIGKTITVTTTGQTAGTKPPTAAIHLFICDADRFKFVNKSHQNGGYNSTDGNVAKGITPLDDSTTLLAEIKNFSSSKNFSRSQIYLNEDVTGSRRNFNIRKVIAMSLGLIKQPGVTIDGSFLFKSAEQYSDSTRPTSFSCIDKKVISMLYESVIASKDTAANISSKLSIITNDACSFGGGADDYSRNVLFYHHIEDVSNIGAGPPTGSGKFSTVSDANENSNVEITTGTCCQSDDCDESTPSLPDTNPENPEDPNSGNDSSYPPTSGEGDSLSPDEGEDTIGNLPCNINIKAVANIKAFCVEEFETFSDAGDTSPDYYLHVKSKVLGCYVSQGGVMRADGVKVARWINSLALSSPDTAYIDYTFETPPGYTGDSKVGQLFLYFDTLSNPTEHYMIALGNKSESDVSTFPMIRNIHPLHKTKGKFKINPVKGCSSDAEGAISHNSSSAICITGNGSLAGCYSIYLADPPTGEFTLVRNSDKEESDAAEANFGVLKDDAVTIVLDNDNSCVATLKAGLSSNYSTIAEVSLSGGFPAKFSYENINYNLNFVDSCNFDDGSCGTLNNPSGCKSNVSCGALDDICGEETSGPATFYPPPPDGEDTSEMCGSDKKTTDGIYGNGGDEAVVKFRQECEARGGNVMSIAPPLTVVGFEGDNLCVCGPDFGSAWNGIYLAAGTHNGKPQYKRFAPGTSGTFYEIYWNVNQWNFDVIDSGLSGNRFTYFKNVEENIISSGGGSWTCVESSQGNGSPCTSADTWTDQYISKTSSTEDSLCKACDGSDAKAPYHFCCEPESSAEDNYPSDPDGDSPSCPEGVPSGGIYGEDTDPKVSNFIDSCTDSGGTIHVEEKAGMPKYHYCCKKYESTPSDGGGNDGKIATATHLCIDSQTGSTAGISGAAKYFKGCYVSGYEAPDDCCPDVNYDSNTTICITGDADLAGCYKIYLHMSATSNSYIRDSDRVAPGSLDTKDEHVIIKSLTYKVGDNCRILIIKHVVPGQNDMTYYATPENGLPVKFPRGVENYQLNFSMGCEDDGSCGEEDNVKTPCDDTRKTPNGKGSPWNKTDGGSYRVVHEGGTWKLYGPEFAYDQDVAQGPEIDPTKGTSKLYATSTDDEISDGITGWEPSDQMLNHINQNERVSSESFAVLRLRVVGPDCCNELISDDDGGIDPEEGSNPVDDEGNPLGSGEGQSQPDSYGSQKDCIDEKFEICIEESCGTDELGAGVPPEPNLIDNMVPHFQTVCGGTEFGGGNIIRRVNKSHTPTFRFMIYNNNNVADSDRQAMQECVDKLDSLISAQPKGPRIKLVTQSPADCLLFFGTYAEMTAWLKPRNAAAHANIPENTAAFFMQFLRGVNNRDIYAGFIWFNTAYLIAGTKWRRSGIWEESTQVLGYGTDVEKYCDGREATDSMFYQKKFENPENSAQGFSPEDIYAIKTLYKDYVTPGKSAPRVAKDVRDRENRQETNCNPEAQVQETISANNFSPCACYEFEARGCDSIGQELQPHHQVGVNGGVAPAGNGNKDLVSFGSAQSPRGYHVYIDGQGHFSDFTNVSAKFDGTAYHTSKDGQQENLCWNMAESHGGTWGRGVGPPIAREIEGYPHEHGYGVAVSFWFKKTGAPSGKMEGVVTHCYGMGQNGEYPSTIGGWGVFYKNGKLIFVVSSQGDGGTEYVSVPEKQGDTQYGSIDTSDEWTHYFFWHNANDKEANEAAGGEGKNGVIAVKYRVVNAIVGQLKIEPVDGNHDNALSAAPGAEFAIGVNKFQGATNPLTNAEIDLVKVWDNVAEFDKMDIIAERDWNDGKGRSCAKGISACVGENFDAGAEEGNTVANPSNVVEGYCPVFEDEENAKNNSPVFRADKVEISGKTYYMPQGLVLGETIFMGDCPD